MCSTSPVIVSALRKSKAHSLVTRQVAEAAVVGRPDELKGQGVVAFVTLERRSRAESESLKTELRDHVGVHIGAIAKPDEVRFAEALPKTRSGKIMRRLLKEIASGKTVTGDTTTLEDFSVLAKLSERKNERARPSHSSCPIESTS